MNRLLTSLEIIFWSLRYRILYCYCILSLTQNQNGNSFKIKRDLLDEKLKDINSLLTEAKAIPIQNPDGSMSFKIEQIQPGSQVILTDGRNGAKEGY